MIGKVQAYVPYVGYVTIMMVSWSFFIHSDELLTKDQSDRTTFRSSSMRCWGFWVGRYCCIENEIASRDHTLSRISHLSFRVLRYSTWRRCQRVRNGRLRRWRSCYDC